MNRVAGHRRSVKKSGKNVGVEACRIPQELGQLIDDCRFWIEHNSYEPDQIAARFHHRLVWIHPYPNGNGRHGRLATGLLLVQLGLERFSWGSRNNIDTGVTREHYVTALQEADRHNFQPLLEFVRSWRCSPFNRLNDLFSEVAINLAL